LRIPVVVAEQNAVPGLANRLVARWARACAVSFPETVLPRAILTGNPVRDEVRDLDRTRDRGGARERLGLDDGHKLVTVYGGSLGARRINRAAARSVPELTAAGDVVLRHIVGSRDWDTEARPDASDVYVPVRYETDMATVLLASDVVVCRAGASTVAELAVAATPSILVPLPGAPGDHKTANARAMVTAGGAVLVPDADLSTERLIAEVRTVLADPDRLASMSAGAATLARRDAAAAVAALAEEHARD
jgi:UDP-N-acetylglucosamine:LPS N-acetylglucosamine transferase